MPTEFEELQLFNDKMKAEMRNDDRRTDNKFGRRSTTLRKGNHVLNR